VDMPLVKSRIALAPADLYFSWQRRERLALRIRAVVEQPIR